MTDQYQEFIESKRVTHSNMGIDVSNIEINPMLFDFQKDIVKWALMRGKAALFEECGLGKTPQQLEWAKHITEYENGKIIVITPLAVAHQTIREGAKFHIECIYCRSQEQADKSNCNIIVTNYDMIEHFDMSKFVGVVLDESSILKTFTGTTKRLLVELFKNTKYKLACTATPAPNDYLELGNHSDFLGIMPSNEMISRWFINDTMRAGAYRLKKHAENDFWKWLTSWAVCLSEPADLGYDNCNFSLPAIKFHNYIVENNGDLNGELFVNVKTSAAGLWKEKNKTVHSRSDEVVKIVKENPDDFYIIWCNTNNEADRLKELFPNALEVRGSHTVKQKEEYLRDFSEGKNKMIITKPDIAGFGLNWQHCRNQIFVGMTYSFEKFYQALRRSWRFMVEDTVNIHIINSETEINVLDVIKRKQGDFKKMQHKMNAAMKKHGLFRNLDERHLTMSNNIEFTEGKNWKMYLGDCIPVSKTIESNSVDFTIFSPPFSSLYIYTDSMADMGNSKDDGKFYEHFSYLPPELLRITKPGRLCAVHSKDLPLYINRDEAAGLRDFPGELIRIFQESSNDEERWVYHSRVTIWKDPVIEMQRTKNHGLLHRNYAARGEVVRQGMADYIIVFRKWTKEMDDMQVQNNPKPGEYIGEEPPKHWDDETHFSIKVWQKYASPVWFDIRQTNVLNIKMARENKDEKHICPLQLDVIARCIDIWTNKNDVVFSPFAGIGSEGYQALKMNRRFVGIELKKLYYENAIKYLHLANSEKKQYNLFEEVDDKKSAVL